MPPGGQSWGDYVASWVADVGTWSGLADELIARGRGSAEVPVDPQTVERGLRRLAKREHKPGGQYGRWMLRLFGFTESVADWVKWMGQYHTRFADMPCSLRLSQLQLWNRPPLSASRLAPWVELGLASVHLRLADQTLAEVHLERAEAGLSRAGVAAEIEAGLFRAKLETDAGDRESARARFARIDELLAGRTLSRADELCYAARLAGQRGYHLTKPVGDEAPALRQALELFELIEEDVRVPFVSFRKLAGMAYCTWKLGDAGAGAALALRAADHAGDGGLVRFRVMAMNMLSRMVDDAEAKRVRDRAEAMAVALEDEDLLARVRRYRP